MALITDINQVLRTDPTNLDEYLRFISGDRVTPRERQFVLKDRHLMGRVRTSLGIKRALAVAMALMDGCFQWRQPGFNGYYRQLAGRYVMGNQQRGLNAFLASNQMQQTLNCWESVLTGLYVIGYITEQQIYNNVYAVLETQSSLPSPQVWNKLGYNTTMEYRRVGNVAAGTLLYYVPANNGRLTQSFPNHIAVSIGNNQAVSLWTQPNNIDSAQRINVVNTFPNHRIFLGEPRQIFS